MTVMRRELGNTIHTWFRWSMVTMAVFYMISLTECEADPAQAPPDLLTPCDNVGVGAAGGTPHPRDKKCHLT